MLARLLKSESLRSAVGFGAGGVGFAAANILLAKELSPASFGVITLALALNQFGMTCGPFGLEVVANRHRLRVGAKLIRLMGSTAVLAGIVVTFAAIFYYHLPPTIAFLTFAMSVGSATNRVGSALFQGGQQLRAAMALSQAPNYILLLAAVLILALAVKSAVFILSVVAIGYLSSAALGWWQAGHRLNAGRMDIDAFVALREGAAAVGIGAAVEMLTQFERLAIPKVGSLEMLSTYAVLAAVAGSPFRMLQIGTSFSLLPRLRSAPNAAAARSVLLREATTAFSVAIVAAIAIALCTPFIVKTLLAGKYAIQPGLIVAAIVVGMAKLWQSFSVTVVSACGSTRALAAISVFAWTCLAIAAAGAVVGSQFGLLGILYGVGFAWVLLAAGGTYLAITSFSARFAALPGDSQATRSGAG
jgi:hypothetical protein